MVDITKHYEFLQSLQFSLITILCIFTLLFIVLHILGSWDYRTRKSRWMRNGIAVRVDEQEGGDATYVLHIVTSRDYKRATTATTTIHLIGRVFPGKLHDIHGCKRKDKFPMFSPMCHERVILQEDVPLDPIIGIVIKTNRSGGHPTWNCRSIIVRNLDTNDAWFFKIRSTVEHAECFAIISSEFLVSLNFAFTRRLRHEWKHGQHVIFGHYFWEKSSVFTFSQRISVMVVAICVLFSLTLMGLSLTMPAGMEFEKGNALMTPQEKKISEAFAVGKYGWSLKGETSVSVWFKGILLTSFFAGLITSLLSFVMNYHFRQREKYEIYLSEMDYVVATALRDICMKKRELQVSNKATLENKDNMKLLFPKQMTPFADENVQEEPPQLEIVPQVLLKRLAPRDARERQRHMFIGGRYLHDPRYTRYLQYPELAPPLPVKEKRQNKQVKMKIFFKDGPPQKEEEEDDEENEVSATEKLATSAMTALAARKSQRQLKELSRQFGSGGDMKKMDSNSIHSLTNLLKVKISMPEIKSPDYSLVINKKFQEERIILPGEQDPKDTMRPFFKPISAWIITIGILLISVFCIGLMCFSGPAGTMHPYLFTLLFLTTFIVGLFNLTFVFEILKICLVALYYSYHDWKLYKLIQDRALLPNDISFQYKL